MSIKKTCNFGLVLILLLLGSPVHLSVLSVHGEGALPAQWPAGVTPQEESKINNLQLQPLSQQQSNHQESWQQHQQMQQAQGARWLAASGRAFTRSLQQLGPLGQISPFLTPMDIIVEGGWDALAKTALASAAAGGAGFAAVRQALKAKAATDNEYQKFGSSSVSTVRHSDTGSAAPSASSSHSSSGDSGSGVGNHVVSNLGRAASALTGREGSVTAPAAGLGQNVAGLQDQLSSAVAPGGALSNIAGPAAAPVLGTIAQGAQAAAPAVAPALTALPGATQGLQQPAGLESGVWQSQRSQRMPMQQGFASAAHYVPMLQQGGSSRSSLAPAVTQGGFVGSDNMARGQSPSLARQASSTAWQSQLSNQRNGQTSSSDMLSSMNGWRPAGNGQQLLGRTVAGDFETSHPAIAAANGHGEEIILEQGSYGHYRHYQQQQQQPWQHKAINRVHQSMTTDGANTLHSTLADVKDMVYPVKQTAQQTKQSVLQDAARAAREAKRVDNQVKGQLVDAVGDSINRLRPVVKETKRAIDWKGIAQPWADAAQSIMKQKAQYVKDFADDVADTDIEIGGEIDVVLGTAANLTRTSLFNLTGASGNLAKAVTGGATNFFNETRNATQVFATLLPGIVDTTTRSAVNGLNALSPAVLNAFNTTQRVTNAAAAFPREIGQDAGRLVTAGVGAAPGLITSLATGAASLIPNVVPWVSHGVDLLSNAGLTAATATGTVMHNTVVPVAQGALQAAGKLGTNLLATGANQGYNEGLLAVLERRSPYQDGQREAALVRSQPATYLPTSFAPMGQMMTITYPCPTGTFPGPAGPAVPPQPQPQPAPQPGQPPVPPPGAAASGVPTAPVGTLIGPGIPCGVPLYMVPRHAVPSQGKPRAQPLVEFPLNPPKNIPPAPSPVPIPTTPLPPGPPGGAPPGIVQPIVRPDQPGVPTPPGAVPPVTNTPGVTPTPGAPGATTQPGTPPGTPPGTTPPGGTTGPTGPGVMPPIRIPTPPGAPPGGTPPGLPPGVQPPIVRPGTGPSTQSTDLSAFSPGFSSTPGFSQQLSGQAGGLMDPRALGTGSPAAGVDASRWFGRRKLSAALPAPSSSIGR